MITTPACTAYIRKNFGTGDDDFKDLILGNFYYASIHNSNC